MISNGLMTDTDLFKRITVFAGHYGSGKTEISLNLAFEMRKLYSDVTVIDLDIVNPFFRSAEHGEELEKAGIKLLNPVYAGTGVDIPTLPADIFSVFANDATHAIFDVGGDDTGAAALGGYSHLFQQAQYSFAMVVNPFRPRSSTVDMIEAMYEAIGIRARMYPDYLISNPNLGETTSISDIECGTDIVLEAARKIGKPVRILSCLPSLSEESAKRTGLPVFPIHRYLKPEWMEV